MRYILKLSEIQELWSVDSKINPNDVGNESLNIPLLHSKYLNIMSKERLIYKALLEKKKQISSTLEDYYDGKIDGRDIGREPCQIKYSTKSQLEKAVESDKEIIQINLKIAASEEIVLFCKEVIHSINQRNFIIKNYIDFKKFTEGF